MTADHLIAKGECSVLKVRAKKRDAFFYFFGKLNPFSLDFSKLSLHTKPKTQGISSKLLVAAGDIKVDDCIFVGKQDGSLVLEAVTGIDFVQDQGIYTAVTNNPFVVSFFLSFWAQFMQLSLHRADPPFFYLSLAYKPNHTDC